MTVVRQLLICMSLVVGLEAHADETDAVERLVDEATTAHPTIASLDHRERALREQAAVAGAWPDPVLSVEYSNAPVTSFGLTEHPMSGLQLKAQQMLRPVGFSRHRKASAGYRADAAHASTQEFQLQLGWNVRHAWWMLSRTRLLRGVTQAHLARAEELLGAATARYETGAVGQHTVLRLQVLRDRLQDDLGDFDSQEAEWSAVLSEAVQGDERRTFPTPADPVAIAPPVPRDWSTAARDTRPTLARIDAEEQAARASADAARVDAMPDPTLWVAYRIRLVQTDQDPGTNFVSVGIGVPIPAGSARQSAGARGAALEEQQAAASRREATLDQIDRDMATILSRWDRAYQKAQTYADTLIPAARTTLETARSDFAVGRADFASLFEAEVALLDLERAHIVAVVDTHLLHAQALATLGADPTGEAP